MDVFDRLAENCNIFPKIPSSHMRDKLNEQFLLYKVQFKKDPDAFAALYDRYIDKIYRFIYLKLSNRAEAEDVTSEVFLKSWNYLIDSANKGRVRSFSGLLYSIARNAVVDVYRKRAKHKECSIDSVEELARESTLIEEIELHQNMQHLLGQIKKLKNAYQEVIVLRYVDDLSITEIAQITGKSNANVRVTLHRALKVLRRLSQSSHE